ncbi:ribbon-helix-helix protein, CopG family [Candidatus Woesearchaeota archaeon]|nr:ribbon-helix-helix protein, CopG family [Candidatus Woesearchaeota archaeon]
MVTEMITLKLEKRFLDTVDDAVKRQGYQSRTEFIRNALREQLDKTKMKEAIAELAHLKGASKRKISDTEYELVRKNAFENL